jgi:hypothetical protein
MYKFVITVFFFPLIVYSARQSGITDELENEKIKIAQKKAEYYLDQLQEKYNEGDYEGHKLYSDSLLIVAELYGFAQKNIIALTNQAVFYNNRSECYDRYK